MAESPKLGRSIYLLPHVSTGVEWHAFYWPTIANNGLLNEDEKLLAFDYMRKDMAVKLLNALSIYSGTLRARLVRHLTGAIGDSDADGYFDISIDGVMKILRENGSRIDVTKVKQMLLNRNTGFVRFFDDFNGIGRGNPEALRHVVKSLKFFNAIRFSKSFDFVQRKLREALLSRFMQHKLKVYRYIDAVLPSLKKSGSNLVRNYGDSNAVSNAIAVFERVKQCISSVKEMKPYGAYLKALGLNNLRDMKKNRKALDLLENVLEELRSPYFIHLFPEATMAIRALKLFYKFRFDWRRDGYNIERVSMIVGRISRTQSPKMTAEFLGAYLGFFYEHNIFPPINYNFSMTTGNLSLLSRSASGFLAAGKRRITCAAFATLSSRLLSSSGYTPFFVVGFPLREDGGRLYRDAHAILLAVKKRRNIVTKKEVADIIIVNDSSVQHIVRANPTRRNIISDAKKILMLILQGRDRSRDHSYKIVISHRRPYPGHN